MLRQRGVDDLIRVVLEGWEEANQAKEGEEFQGEGQDWGRPWNVGGAGAVEAGKG